MGSPSGSGSTLGGGGAPSPGSSIGGHLGNGGGGGGGGPLGAHLGLAVSSAAAAAAAANGGPLSPGSSKDDHVKRPMNAFMVSLFLCSSVGLLLCFKIVGIALAF